MEAETEFQFDGWTVNRASGEIARGGRGSRLSQQPLRILLELYDHAGAVVTREHLVKVLWPAGVVDFDNGLNVAVRKLRVALDDVGDVPRYVETLPRVGYRFIGHRGATAATDEGRRRSPRLLIALLASIVLLGGIVALAWRLGSPAHGATPEGATPPRHVPSVRAQDFYLEGLQQRSRRDIDSSKLAVAAFEAALREDPAYAQAWAGLGEILSAEVIRQQATPAEGVPKARHAVERALALDPDLVEGHYLLGEILMDHDKDFPAARQEFERARALNDKAARLWHHYGMWYGHLGRMDEALTALRRARELEPMTLLYAANYGLLLYEARRYDEAMAFLTPLVEANAKFDQARSVLARAMLAAGNPEGALQQLQKRTSSGAYQADLGVTYARLGRRADAMHEIDRLEERGRAGFAVAYDLALIDTELGDLDGACAALTRAVSDHSILVNWMRLEPRLDPLRGRQCYADAETRLYGTR